MATTLNHNMIPFLGKAKPIAQIKTVAEVRAYAAAGFHVCVDQSAKAGAGTTRAVAWQNAGAAYLRAYVAATADVIGAALGGLISMLRTADSQATAAAALTPVASHGGSASEGPPRAVAVDPASAAPPFEQVQQQTEMPGLQIGGLPWWALVLPLGYLAYKKFAKKGKGRRRGRR